MERERKATDLIVAPSETDGPKPPLQVQLFDFSLTEGRRVRIEIFGRLTRRDIEIIRKQLEVFHLQCEVAGET